MTTEQVKTVTDDQAVTASDIVFDCPACGKSLVVDEAAEGMIVDCPQCRTNVIVPPKSTRVAAPTSSKKEEPRISEPTKLAPPDAVEDPLQKRLSVLAGQLKEIQAQRTEVTGRIASRLNDVNRDLVIIARLETSQQQILSEWNQLVEKISSGRAVIGIRSRRTRRDRRQRQSCWPDARLIPPVTLSSPGVSARVHAVEEPVRPAPSNSSPTPSNCGRSVRISRGARVAGLRACPPCIPVCAGRR